ncbi:hypothetical protein I4U23_011860 [Adineta vaga]|nr:hypothetical protein I4U23_011860 [Adineta vaga]
MYFRPFRLFKVFIIFVCVCTVIYELHRFLPSTSSPHPIPSISRNENNDHVPQQPVSSKDIEHISQTLEPFYITLPHFSDDEAKTWFYGSSYYQIHSKSCSDGTCEKQGVLFNNTKEHLSVNTFLVPNGLYLNDECGYNYGDTAMKRTFYSTDEATVVYDQAIIYTVPDGWSFQHFLDGVGPKLAHSQAYLQKYPDAKVVILKGVRFDRSVQEIWSMLGVENENRIVHYSSNMKVGARLLINPCRTPGIHPRLWQDARHMYWSISGMLKSATPPERKNFIYIQRTSSNAMNNGRLILNEQAFVEVLRSYCSKHSLNYVQYDHSKDTGHIPISNRTILQCKSDHWCS